MYSIDSIDKYSADVTCQLTAVPNAKIQTMKSMATVKRSPYLGLFRHTTRKLQESGIAKKLLVHSSTKLPKIDVPLVIVAFESVVPTLYVLIIGTIAAITIANMFFTIKTRPNTSEKEMKNKTPQRLSG
ncbi:uncharacterized protein LOC110832218 [Zootermopsis nevadensis]|uniref:uncharacterized protein LOC110832218 n=1 Tax=Zootermopsis nevadensis TaxID=136037 RepID=UPI000B8E7AC4|nr:uncharacterized protein LOC110832218 [Zootermopsis nevadensis]